MDASESKILATDFLRKFDTRLAENLKTISNYGESLSLRGRGEVLFDYFVFARNPCPLLFREILKKLDLNKYIQ